MTNILLEKKGLIAVATINRPKALNALNSEVLTDLDELVSAVKADADIRALVITGSGEKAFVAGADIGEMSTLTKEGGEAFGKHGNDVFRAIETLPIPTIAAVNGFALGGGCELSMACDIRICADTAVFGQPETGLGITPGFGGTQRLARGLPHRPGQRRLSPGRAAARRREAGRDHRQERAYRRPRLQAGHQRGPSGGHGQGHRHRGKALRQLLPVCRPDRGYVRLPGEAQARALSEQVS